MLSGGRHLFPRRSTQDQQMTLGLLSSLHPIALWINIRHGGKGINLLMCGLWGKVDIFLYRRSPMGEMRTRYYCFKYLWRNEVLVINSCLLEQLISETDGDKTAFTEECRNQNKAFHLFVPVWNLLVEFPNAFSNHYLFVLLLHESGCC